MEIEEELPVVTKRESKVEVELPKREETKIETKEPSISDAPALGREERSKAPIYFDDKAFEDLKTVNLPKKEEIKSVPKRENIRKPIDEVYKGNTKNEEAKIFKPSPIISPVYGVLEQNYQYEDIKAHELEKPTVAVNRKKAEVTVDDIRNKAYGTLEDDLENTFFTNSILNEKYEEEAELDIFEGIKTREERNSKVDLLREDYQIKETEKQDDISKELEKQKQKIEEINEYIKNSKNKNTDLENNLQEEEQTKEEIEEVVEEEPIVLTKEEQNDGVESELFDLIDSMYEKRDE